MKPLDNVEVIYSDNHILVANKPSNLLTQKDAFSDESLEEILKDWVKHEFHKPGNVFLHCIHRLDKPVSGLVLFARTSKALSRLNEKSRNLEIQRIYEAEVEGILKDSEGKLDHFLIHADHRALVAKEGDEGAKHARLTYSVLQYLPHATKVKIELDTGRYHQIRAQFAEIGHPIKGDKKYGSSFGDGQKIFLHCSSMSFEHPVTKELMNFQAPTPFFE